MKNTLIKVLSFLMALTMIVGVFSAITVSAAECDHTKGEQVGEPVPATCAKPGYTFYECAKCGEIYPDDVVPKSKEHTGVTEVPAADANCFLPAMNAYSYCADCQVNEKGEPTAFIKAPSFVKDSEALGHNFVGADNGKTQCELITEYKCTLCGLTAEVAHYYASYYFEVYGVSYDDNDYLPFYSQVKGEGHDWVYEVKTAPQTCVDGVMVGECKVCGSVQEVAITATHDFTKPFLDCEEYVGYKCSLCGVPSPSAYPNLEPEHNLDKTAPVRGLNTALEALGYTQNTLYKDPTCTENGYYVYQCKDCEAYVEEVAYAVNHKYSNVLSFEPNKNTSPCGGEANVGGTYYYACTNTFNGVKCEERLVLDTKADKGHLLKTTVEPSTCAAEGYTVVECLLCDYEVKSNYTAKLDHELGEYLYSYDITAGVDHTQDYYRYQKCANCSYTTEPEMLIKATTDGNHKISDHTTIVAATCTTPAFEAYYCEVEGCTYITADNPTTTDVVETEYKSVPNGTVDKKNHDPAQLKSLEAYQAATCTKAGWEKYWCNNCEVEITVTIPTLPHNFGNKYNSNPDKDGDYEDAADKYWVEVKATCLKTGKTAGICCENCGLTKVAPQITPIDPSNHVDSTGKPIAGVEVKTVGPNCQNYGYTKYYYPCCNTYSIDYAVKAEGVDIDETNHVNTTKHDYVAPTCGNAGSHGYEICNDCGAIVNYDNCTCGVDHSAVVTPVILGLAHTWTWVNAKYESCDEIGWTGHWLCTSCKATDGKTVIPAHGKQYQTTLKYQAPTCTEDGLWGSGDTKVCTKCEIEYLYGTASYYNWVIPALGHGGYVQTAGEDTPDDFEDDVIEWVNYYVEYAAPADDCTTASGIVYECPTCKYSYSLATDFVPAKKEEHTFNAVWEAYTVKDNKIYLNGVDTGYMACEHATYEFRKCTTPGCEYVETRNENAAINHYTLQDGTKKDLLLDCQNIADAVGYICELCKLPVTTNTEPTHKLAKAQQDKTCTQDGYYIHVCADCGLELDVDGRDPAFSMNPAVYFVDEAPGHNPYDVGYYNEDLDEFVWGILDGKADNIVVDNPMANAIYAVNGSVEYVVESKKPTASEDGFVTYRCKTCNETVTVVIPALKGLGFTVTTDDAFVNGTTVTVKIAVDANKFAFNSFMIAIPYDVDALEYVGAKLVYDGFAAADAVTLVADADVYGDYYDEFGIVTMNVYVPNGIDGEPKNVELTADGAAFIEVTFNVRATAVVDGSAIYDVISGEYKIVDEEGELVDINGVNDEIEAEADYEAFVVNFAGDVNGDVTIDQGDAVAIMSAIYASEYSAAADLNKDGVVDLLDLGAVLQFTVSKGDMLAYLEMTGVSIDDVVAGYKLRYDLNGDGNINDTDKALLADSIVEAIEELEVPYYAMSYVFYFADVNSLEELVAHAAKQLVNGDEIFEIAA